MRNLSSRAGKRENVTSNSERDRVRALGRLYLRHATSIPYAIMQFANDLRLYIFFVDETFIALLPSYDVHISDLRILYATLVDGFFVC